jgi:tetratricopeptide (TPR) repeat protein
MKMLRQLNQFFDLRGFMADAIDLAKLFLDSSANFNLPESNELADLHWFKGQFDWLSGNQPESVHEFTQSLEMSENLGYERTKAYALVGLGKCLIMSDDFKRGEELITQGKDLHHKLGNTLAEAQAQNQLGISAFHHGGNDALEHFEIASKIFRHFGFISDQADCLNNIAGLEQSHGHLVQAKLKYEQVLELRDQTRDNRGKAISLYNLGQIAIAHNELDRAGDYNSKAYDIGLELNDNMLIAISQNGLGDRDKAEGKYTDALSAYHQAFNHYSLCNHKIGISFAIEGIAECAHKLGNPSDACVLISYAAHQREILNSQPSKTDSLNLETIKSEIKTLLGDTVYEQQWEIGTNISKSNIDELCKSIISKQSVQNLTFP